MSYRYQNHEYTQYRYQNHEFRTNIPVYQYLLTTWTNIELESLIDTVKNLCIQACKITLSLKTKISQIVPGYTLEVSLIFSP